MFRYNTHGLLGIAAGIIDIAVGLVVLSRNPKSQINRSFFFVTYAPFVWITTFAFESLVRTNDAAFFWQRVAYASGVPFIPLAFFTFSRAWTKQRLSGPSIWTAFCWSVTASIPMTFYTHQVVGMEEYSWGRFPYFLPTAGGRLYAAYVLIPFFFFAFLSARNFYLGWRHASSPQERRQFKTLLIGFTIAHVGVSDFITGFHYDFYPCGYISLSIFISMVAYTIVRHQFLEINLLLQKIAAIFLIYALLIAIVTPLGFIFLGHTLSTLNNDQVAHVLAFCFICAVFISMGPLAYAYLTRTSFWLRSKSSTGLTHELKSPLSAIESSVYVLLQTQSRETISTDTLKSYLGIIDRNAQRLRVFINDLLRLAQIQNDDLGITKTNVDLNDILKDVIEQYKPQAQQKGVTLLVYADNLRKVEVDQEKIRQTISNLLSNAVKFSDHGTVQIRIKSTECEYTISIQDQGRGIPAADIERIFDRFYQGRHSVQGSGIGLTIAKAWVEAHGGKIWVESDGEGKGTTVTFTLPCT